MFTYSHHLDPVVSGQCDSFPDVSWTIHGRKQGVWSRDSKFQSPFIIHVVCGRFLNLFMPLFYLLNENNKISIGSLW